MKVLFLMSVSLQLYVFAVTTEVLDVGSDCLPQLPCKCVHKKIDCSRLNIKALNESTLTRNSNVDNFTELIFAHNSIEIIRDTVFPDQLLGIRSVDVSFNHIETIEEGAFHGFGNLSKLNLRHNRLRNLTAEMFLGLSQLTELDLGYNHFHNLPEDVFSSLTSLEKLRLRYNSLTNLPSGIFQNLVSLENLDLYSTGLTTLNFHTFSQNKHLESLILAGNSFANIPKHVFGNLSKLKVLDISDNPLHEIPPHAFVGLNSLEQLTINNIPTLEVIREHAFANLTRLKVLSCSFNRRLATINHKAFMKDKSAKFATKSLHEVLIRQNALRSLANDTLPWRHIEELDLAENPWHCDCHLRWMNAVPNDMVLCDSPASLHRKPIFYLDPKQFVCESPHDSDIHISIALIIGLFFAGVTVMIIILCWRFKLLTRVRSSYQQKYKQMRPNIVRDRMELDEASESI